MPEDVDFSERKSILRRTREEFGNSSAEACSVWASGSSSAVCVGKGSSSIAVGASQLVQAYSKKGLVLQISASTVSNLVKVPVRCTGLLLALAL